jgi:hypothetical protein
VCQEVDRIFVVCHVLNGRTQGHKLFVPAPSVTIAATVEFRNPRGIYTFPLCMKYILKLICYFHILLYTAIKLFCCIVTDIHKFSFPLVNN